MTDGPGGQSVGEALDNQRPIRNAAFAGLDVLDADARLTFTLYKRVVLPADGFVFWVRADMLANSALYNSSPINTFAFNASPVTVSLQQFDAGGSLHRSTQLRQEEAEGYAQQSVILTSKVMINQLNATQPDELWVADWSPELRFAFSSRSGWYEQAGLYHYRGDAVYPSTGTQLVDGPGQLLSRFQVVSNSLPIWLQIAPGFFPVYPSYLIPYGVRPPYGVIHIGEDDTTPLTSAPTYGPDLSRYQLTKDRVRVTTYGVRNDLIFDWMDAVNAYTLANPGVIGLMNTPVPRDSKRPQVELGVIAQRKVIDFEVDYYQTRMRDIARQLILSAFIDVFTAFVNDEVVIPISA